NAPMALCDPDTASRENIAPNVLSKARAEAQAFSNKIYGADCFVCAEIYGSDPDTFRLHITSPVDAIINTSAGVTVRKSDGKIVERQQWHSCHARIIHRAN